MKSLLLAMAVLAVGLPALAQTNGQATPPATTPVDPAIFLEVQNPDEWRVGNYMGQPVMNASGEKIGNINDILFSRTGQMTTIVIGVGGFLGLGEKQVAIPFTAVTYVEKDGVRQITVPMTKEILKSAPSYKHTEKTTLDIVREKAGEVATKASEKATELKDQAVKKIEEYNAEEKTEAEQKQ